MKKVISLLLSIVMLLSITAGLDLSAYAYTSGDFEYDLLNDGTAEITEYTGYATDLTIPSTLDGYTVTSIGERAFWYCNSLSNVTIQDGVTNIGDYAFEWCKSLTSIVIPNSVTDIGAYAFNICVGLLSVDIPNSVRTIGDNAFSNCENLENVTIGNNVETIGNGAFFQCLNLTNVIIPDNVKTIGDEAFANCENLENVTIGNSVEGIANLAFAWCYNLKSIIIPNSVTSIGDQAFYDCKKLENITIGNSVEVVGNSAFENCSSLTSIIIPNSVKTIGEYALWCDSLTIISIMNKNCNIYDNIETIPYKTTIYGYANSTAWAYAEKYNRDFVAIDDYNCSENIHLYSIAQTFLETKYTCVLCGYSYFEENHWPLISVNETKTVSIEKGGDRYYFKFTPSQDGTYCLYSEGEYDTYGYLYDEDMYELDSDDDGGEGNNFSITCYLEKDKTYYFACKMYDSNAIGSFDVTLEKIPAYAEPDETTTTMGGSIRVGDVPGLRFGFQTTSSEEDAEEYGFIYAYEDTTDLSIDKVGTDGVKKLVAQNKITHDEGYTTFNLVFTEIPASAYDTVVSARSYVVIDGEYHYSEVISYSFRQIANLVLADDEIDEATKSKVEDLLNKEA